MDIFALFINALGLAKLIGMNYLRVTYLTFNITHKKLFSRPIKMIS